MVYNLFISLNFSGLSIHILINNPEKYNFILPLTSGSPPSLPATSYKLAAVRGI
jgi:hypothetical protein